MIMHDLATAAEERSVLDTVAQRVRGLRALRGMSRKILAEQAQVSVRHLGQIEAGTGNVSIKLLGQIAAALGVSAAELLSTPQSSQHALLADLLETLSPEQCSEAEAIIRRELLGVSPPHGIVTLIGLRGAGKTTLGRRLAELRGVPFLRITELIEQRAGMPVAEIHSLSGQLGYRRHELEAVEQSLASGAGAVIEAGGSIVANNQAFSALLSGSFVIWLQTSPQEHMDRVVEQGDLRPLEGRKDAMDDLLAILEERSPKYAQAHARLDTSGTDPEQSLARLAVMTESRIAT